MVTMLGIESPKKRHQSKFFMSVGYTFWDWSSKSSSRKYICL